MFPIIKDKFNQPKGEMVGACIQRDVAVDMSELVWWVLWCVKTEVTK